jgi:dihydrofolate reductase
MNLIAALSLNQCIGNKGKIPWSKGLKLSKEFGEKVSKSKLAAKKITTDKEKENISKGTKKAMQNP